MKKILIYSLIILLYNSFVLFLPVEIFLLGLSLPWLNIFDVFSLIYTPFLIFSPVLALYLCSGICKNPSLSWVYPLTMCYAGYLPVLTLYLSFSSIWSLRDYFIIMTLPLIIGLSSYFLGKLRYIQIASVRKTSQ